MIWTRNKRPTISISQITMFWLRVYLCCCDTLSRRIYYLSPMSYEWMNTNTCPTCFNLFRFRLLLSTDYIPHVRLWIPVIFSFRCSFAKKSKWVLLSFEICSVNSKSVCIPTTEFYGAYVYAVVSVWRAELVLEKSHQSITDTPSVVFRGVSWQ